MCVALHPTALQAGWKVHVESRFCSQPHSGKEFTHLVDEEAGEGVGGGIALLRLRQGARLPVAQPQRLYLRQLAPQHSLRQRCDMS